MWTTRVSTLGSTNFLIQKTNKLPRASLLHDHLFPYFPILLSLPLFPLYISQLDGQLVGWLHGQHLNWPEIRDTSTCSYICICILVQHLTLATICSHIRELFNANAEFRVVIIVIVVKVVVAAASKNLFVLIIELGKLSLGQCSVNGF